MRKEVLVLIVFFVGLWAIDFSPIERFIKLSPEKREIRIEHLQSVDTYLEKCKLLNSRYSSSNTYSGWWEHIYSFGEWYEPRLSTALIRVGFSNADYDQNTYCDVDISWSVRWEPDIEFFNRETFSNGYDSNGGERLKSYPNYYCSDRNGKDWDEDGRCFKND
ncbi:hypothetical protein N8292_00485 [Gammaproteobacteria bacterium]|jgi:hypothetical protein|nr:hypothetical protein [Gammaproteobacteria bacterium]